jgi:hypothetical protein
MKFLSLAVEQSNKACDWRRLHELLPVLVKRLLAGEAAALQATDPCESLRNTLLLLTEIGKRAMQWFLHLGTGAG